MIEKPKNINLNFGDGRVSKIDSDVHKLIVGFQNEINSLKSKLPLICYLSLNIKVYSEYLL